MGMPEIVVKRACPFSSTFTPVAAPIGFSGAFSKAGARVFSAHWRSSADGLRPSNTSAIGFCAVGFGMGSYVSMSIIAVKVAGGQYERRTHHGACAARNALAISLRNGLVEKAPCLHKSLVLVTLLRWRKNEGDLYVGDSGDGHDVPDVFGNDIDGHEIHGPVVVKEDAVIRHQAAMVRALKSCLVVGGLDLDAKESSGFFQNDVITCAIAPGSGDGEAE